jgi:hypothetical protein
MRERVSLQAAAQLLEVGESISEFSAALSASLQVSSDAGVRGGARALQRAQVGLVAYRSGLPLSSKKASCTEQGQDAVIDRSLQVSRPFVRTDKLGRTSEGRVDKSLDFSTRFTRRDDQPLRCVAGGSEPDITADASKVLDVINSLTSSVHLERSLKAPSGELLNQVTADVTKKGERRMSWSLEGEGTPEETHTRTVFSTMQQEVTLTRRGKTTRLESSLSSADNKPLIFAFKQPSTKGSWTRAILRSGALVTTEAGGAVTETSFDNVVLTRESPCMPESGSIRGVSRLVPAQVRAGNSTFFAKGAVNVSYEITFESGEAWIQFSGNSEREELAFTLCSGLE